MRPVNESDIAVLVTVDAVFPGTTADDATMRAALTHLSRDDALFACARINSVVSGFAPTRSLRVRQTQAIDMLCSGEQKQALSRYATKHGGPDRVIAFFRGQLLELARWVASYCENQAGDGETFSDATVRSAFVRAALIASGLWEKRLYGPQGIKPSAAAGAFLGAFRKSVEEGNQASHAGFMVSRGWLLFSRYLPAHLPAFDELFRQSTGLTLRQYFISASAVLDRSFSDKIESERIFKTQYVQDGPFRETFNQFVRMNAQTPEEWAQTLSHWPDSGYRSMRERPIFSFARDRSIIFDATFYIDNLTAAPLFRAISQGVSSNTAFAAFGMAFEDYATDLLRERFPSGSGVLFERLRCNVKGKTTAGQSFEVDAVLNDISSVAMFEMKAAWIKEDTITAPDSQVFLDEIRRKYGYIPHSDDRPKGVAQLARSVGALVRREWLGRDNEYAQATAVFPVLTVFDVRMATPGTGHFLAEEFRSLLRSVPAGRFVHPLIVLTVSDLEQLVFGVESLSLPEFLRAYSSADPDRTSSVHNFIANSEFLNQVRPSPVLESSLETLMQAAREELSPTSEAGR